MSVEWQCRWPAEVPAACARLSTRRMGVGHDVLTNVMKDGIMTVRAFLTIAAVLAFIFGVFQLLLPSQLATLYGIASQSEEFIGIMRLLGAAHIGMGVIAWGSRDADGVQVKTVLLGILALGICGLGATLYRQLVTGGPPMDWLNAVIYLGLTVGSFLLSRKPGDALGRAHP